MDRIDFAVSIQTLSHKENAAIFCITAKPFSLSFDEIKETYVMDTCVDVLSCISHGMDIDPYICQRWAKQPKDIKEKFQMGNDIMFAVSSFVNYIETTKKGNEAEKATIWLHRADIYAPILRNALVMANKRIPWNDIADVDTFVRENVRLLNAITFPDEFRPTCYEKGEALREVNNIISDVTWIAEQYQTVLK